MQTVLLTEDQIAIRDTVRAFMEKEVKLVMGRYDASGASREAFHCPAPGARSLDDINARKV